MREELEEQLLIYRLETTQDEDAFAELYRRYKSALYRFILFRVSNAEIADDVTADVFLKLWAWVVERRRITHFRGLLYRIARNTVIDQYHAAKPTISLEEAEMVAPITEDLGITVGGAIDREVVTRAVMELDSDDMELLTLFY